MALLEDIEAFLETHEISATALGHQALGDRHFVRQLRMGRRVWPETETKVRQFMDDFVGFHGAGDSANLAEVSQGKAGENFPPCGQHQSSPVTPPTGGAAPGGDGSASGESREQDQLPGRADCHTEARSGEGLAPEGTSGGSAGLRSGSPANASQSAGASAAAIVAKRDGSGASCADDMPEAAE